MLAFHPRFFVDSQRHELPDQQAAQRQHRDDEGHEHVVTGVVGQAHEHCDLDREERDVAHPDLTSSIVIIS